jgi:hypothetical protein
MMGELHVAGPGEPPILNGGHMMHGMHGSATSGAAPAAADSASATQ